MTTVIGGAPPPTPAPARTASFSYPCAVVFDGKGGFYFAAKNFVFKVDSRGELTRIAGKSSVTAYSGDGGPAIEAQLYSPMGLALDKIGNLYIVDWGNGAIRKVSPEGIISSVIGTGKWGYTSDGARASGAQLDGPIAVAVDTEGVLYIAEFNSHSIRKITTEGILTTVAGSRTSGYSGDGGLATRAQLSGPHGVALDKAGSLYITDYLNSRVRKVDAEGVITTVAGNGLSGDQPEEARAIDSPLPGPIGIAVDDAGSIYVGVTASNRIRKVKPDGTIVTVAGGGSLIGVQSDGSKALNASFQHPYAVTVDDEGTLLVADVYNSVVHKVATDGTIHTAAGTGSPGYSGDGGPAVSAQIGRPKGVALDSAGNLYIAEEGNHVVRRIGADGLVRTIAGNGVAGYSGDHGPAVRAQLRRPATVTVDRSGNVYIADSGNFCVRRVSPDGLIETVAGIGVFGNPRNDDGQLANRTPLQAASSIAVDSAGVLYIADYTRIRNVTSDGIITTAVGNGESGYSGDGGAATNARISCPIISLDSKDNLYITDYCSCVVRRVDADGTIATVAGNGLPGYPGDGVQATSARLHTPGQVAVDSAGNLFIPVSIAQVVQKVDMNGIVRTIAGTPVQSGYSADGVLARNALLFHPWGSAVDPLGNVYVSDLGLDAVFLLKPIP